MQETKSLQPEVRDLLIGIGIFFVFCLVFYSIGDKHQGRHDFPCYCKPCEEKTVKQAIAGDQKSIQALQAMSVQGGVYSDDTQVSKQMGPLAFIFGFLIVVVLFVGIPTLLTKAKQKVVPPTSGFSTSVPASRVSYPPENRFV